MSLLSPARRPTLADAQKEPAPPAGGIRNARVLWGPISPTQSKAAGAAYPTSSVLLRPDIPDQVRKAAVGEVPVDVLPNAHDDADSLRRRLARSKFLEDMHVLKNGRGPDRVRLNETTYAQPRRVSWSVVVEDAHEDADGDHVTTLLNYTAYGRLPADWRARAMPAAVYDLGVAVWRSSYDVLTPVSRAHPPSGCQLLLYYQVFGSCMGRHRDNYNTAMSEQVRREGAAKMEELLEGNHHGGDANSQVLGSNVLVYTEGDADMTFTLSFPPNGSRASNMHEYIIHPSFCTKLAAGTLLVFTPTDDLFFCHEACFHDGEGTHRLAFVFRWLSQPRDFYQGTEAMKLSEKLREKTQEKQAAKRKKSDNERRAGLKGLFG